VWNCDYNWPRKILIGWPSIMCLFFGAIISNDTLCKILSIHQQFMKRFLMSNYEYHITQYTLSLSLSLSVYIYIYIYICVCVMVNVCWSRNLGLSDNRRIYNGVKLFGDKNVVLSKSSLLRCLFNTLCVIWLTEIYD